MGFFDKLKGAMTMPSPSDVKAVNERGSEMRRLREEGEPGKATISDWRDTGQKMAGNMVLDLDLHVRLDSGEEYDTTINFTIAGTDTAPYEKGKEYAVRVDPNDHANLTFGA